jgi:hypothetical protein
LGRHRSHAVTGPFLFFHRWQARPGYPDRIKHVRLTGTAEAEEQWLDSIEVFDMWPHLLAQVDAVLFS